ncbi:MAG: MFS transporter, partial [Acidobacteriota bacterium]
MTEDHALAAPGRQHLEPPVAYRWIVLLFLSLPMLGNYYIYDSINPLADIFVQQLGFTDEHIGWLNSSYSVAAVLTLLIGGIIIDRIGVKKSLALFSFLCLAGAVLTAMRGSFSTMVAGRAVLGLGAESLIVAATTGLAKWFKGKELSFAFGVNLTIARLASVAADRSPTWASSVFYPRGPQAEASWQGPLWIAVLAGIICLAGSAVYWWLENRAAHRYALGKGGDIDRLEFREVFRFSRSYWLIVGLCITFYSAIFPFRTFAIKFFMHRHFAGLPADLARESAGFFNSLLPLSAMIATPLFGLLADKAGKRALLMVVGSFLLMPVYLMMAYSDMTLWVPVTLMGIAFSLIPAVMWPSVAYIVEESRLGTAYALMTLIQQIGFFALNLSIGIANDAAGAGADNPGGYALGMWIFSILGFVGLFFAILLR